MAIQFPCPSCSQPIEVDDEFAGQTAGCPYCRSVVGIPVESTLAPRGRTTARPINPAAAEGGPTPLPPPPTERRPDDRIEYAPGSLHVGRTPRDLRAIRMGRFSLYFTVLTYALLAVLMLHAATVAMNSGLVDRIIAVSASRPSMQQQEQLQQELAKQLEGNKLFYIGHFLSAISAVVGLSLAIASLRASARGNWRAIVSVAFCGPYVLCCCVGNGLSLVSV